MNTRELAWAAGFFDGEGSFFTAAKPDGWGQLVASVAQTEPYGDALLNRFKAAVFNCGKVYGPYNRGRDKRVLMWRATTFEDVQAVVALLWKFLGPAKRAQALKALTQAKNHRR